MKKHIMCIIAGLLILSGCKTQQMTAVERPEKEKEPIAIPRDEAKIEVESPEILSLEESFSFARKEDKDRHDDQDFFVIMGSFRNENNAVAFQKTLREKGFNPVILLSETGLHRISVDSFKQENEARSRILSIRNQYSDYEDTWLLIRKHTTEH